MSLPTQDQVTDKLRAVIDPELRRNIVELGMVRAIDVAEDGRVGVIVSLTTPGCPIRSHFQQAVVQNVSQLDGVTAVGVEFDVLSEDERAALQQSLGRSRLPQGALAQVKNVICVASGKGGVGGDAGVVAPAAGRPRPGQERDLRGLGQGRGRQVHHDRQPGRRARRGGPERRRPGLRRLRLLDPADARPRRAPRGERRAQDRPAPRARGRQGHVDRLLRRGERRGRLARPDAPQGHPAVPRGRRLGRDRIPPARPAAGHRRRLDDAGDPAPAGEDHDRHDPAARRAVGGSPGGRDGREGGPGGARRDREHVRVHDPGRPALHDLRRGRRSAPGRRARRPAPRQGAALRGAALARRLGKVPLSEELRSHADSGAPLVLSEPDAPASVAIRQAARGIIAATPQELAVLQSEPPAMASAAPVGGTELNVIQS